MKLAPEISQLNLFEPLEEQILPKNGNTSLVDYGIATEKSDYRIHVTPKVMRVYTFPTKSGVELVHRAADMGLKTVPVYTGTIQTALGVLAPLSYIKGLQETLIPPSLLYQHPFHEGMNTSAKGLQATRIVVSLLRSGEIPLPLNASEPTSLDLQISGTDILVNSSIHLQVKCDLPGGERKYGGSGNLFIQIAECNPYKRH